MFMKHLKFYFYAILQNNTENMKLQNNAEIKHTQKTESTRFNIYILKQRSKFKKHNVYNILVSETWMSCKMQDTL